jgi:hypothetical protein
MQKVRHVGGREKLEILRNPQAVFDGVAAKIDLGGLSERIKGIGSFPFVARPTMRAGIFDDVDHPIPQGAGQIAIECSFADGSTSEVTFQKAEDFLDFYNATRAALERGDAEVILEGQHIPVNREFVQQMDRVAHVISKKHNDKGGLSKDGKYLLIDTNEEELGFTAPTQWRDIPAASLPKNLIIPLKQHQTEGFAWLQRSYMAGRGGCLLADDMGLGKTLQVLSFLAWRFENLETVLAAGRRDGPVLIVAPVILLEAETWLGEMRRFFRDDGVVFGSPLVLRDAELRRLRKVVGGRETSVGEPVLDLRAIANHRVVLTNYETVTNYQHSMAHIPWSVVITDEAQEYKTPSTKISHALKSLNVDFRIAATGTPVETRLLDVWNVFDFLQPGLLETAKDFTKRYEKPLEKSDSTATTPLLLPLKQTLGLNQEQGFVFRRDKGRLSGLPEKIERTISAPLSPRQRELHNAAISMLQNGEAHPFSVLHMLAKIYQHPALLEPGLRITPADLLNECPKLAVTLTQLQNIRNSGEKCLVFTRSIQMQQLLSTAFRYAFGLEVGIVNGASPKKGDTHAGRTSREKLLRRFRESNGFDILILSPDVAGIGLTLVEANHVIHYGRWWNPAREAQATDRIYRIGQTRDVHVYYPIAVDPTHEIDTFDEKLDRLLVRRKAFAADFLTPLPGEDELGNELIDDLKGESGSAQRAKPLSIDDVRALTWDRFEAFVASTEEKTGRTVLLTPKANDGGADVFSCDKDVIRLIQCKHSRHGLACEDPSVHETIAAVDLYRARLGSGLGDRRIQPVLVTCGTFSRSAVKAAREHGVTLIDGEALKRASATNPITILDVEAWSTRRERSFASVLERLSLM